jgi:hypothetical protein
MNFKPWSGQIKDYDIGIGFFLAKYEELRSKSKDWLVQYHDNVQVERHVYTLTVVSVS